MNGFKRNIIGVFIFALMLLVIVFINQLPDGKTDREPKPDLTNVLTRAEIEKALSEKGFYPVKVVEDDGTYSRDDITPVIYYLNDTDTIILYDYASIAERTHNVSVTHLGDSISVDYPMSDIYIHWTFPIRNFSLVYRIDTEAMPDSIFVNKMDNDLNRIKQVALDFNNGKEALLYGKGTNWEAQSFVEYYQNWYEDKDGEVRADQLSKQNLKVRYLGPENEKPQSIQYEYIGGGTGRGAFRTISADKDGWVKVVSSAGSGFIPNPKTVCTLNLVWGNNKETIRITPQNS